MWKRARRRGEGMLYYVLQLVIGVCREALFWGGLAGGTRLGHFWLRNGRCISQRTRS